MDAIHKDIDPGWLDTYYIIHSDIDNGCGDMNSDVYIMSWIGIHMDPGQVTVRCGPYAGI